MSLFYQVALTISGIWLLFFSVVVESTTFKGRIMFKFMPLLCALVCLSAVLIDLGFVIQLNQ